MSLEVKPVPIFLFIWLKIASSALLPTQMNFEIVFWYISVYCDMQLTFFDLRMDGKKGQSDDAPKKLNGK